MNCELKACRPKYFQAKVEHLKECKPSAWWNEIKKLSGCSPAFREKSYATKSLQHLYGPSDDITLANIINKAFSRPCLVSHRSLLITSYFPLTAQPYNLRLLYQTSWFIRNWWNWTEAKRMVLVTSWVVTERKCRFTGSADSRYSQFILSRKSSPTLMERSWCCAGAQAKTCAGHKQTPSTHLPDTKPVKIAKDYVVDTYVKPAVLSKVDPQQFGTVPKSSTTYTLINMIHSWAK